MKARSILLLIALPFALLMLSGTDARASCDSQTQCCVTASCCSTEPINCSGQNKSCTCTYTCAEVKHHCSCKCEALGDNPLPILTPNFDEAIGGSVTAGGHIQGAGLELIQLASHLQNMSRWNIQVDPEVEDLVVGPLIFGPTWDDSLYAIASNAGCDYVVNQETRTVRFVPFE